MMFNDGESLQSKHRWWSDGRSYLFFKINEMAFFLENKVACFYWLSV